MATVVVRRGHVKPLLFRHPWVFREAVGRAEGAAAGAEVDVRAPDGRFLGRGVWSETSALAVRIFSWHEGAALDEAAIRERVATAVAYRHGVLGLGADTTGYRVVHGDGDLLPGLVVDRYGDHLVLQVSSVAIEQRLPLVTASLADFLHPQGIHRSDDPAICRAEGLAPVRATISGEAPNGSFEFRECGLEFTADNAFGQKTGFYLDQRENRQAAARLAPARRVLDLFAYSGGFAVACARAGAALVEAVDSSQLAVERIGVHARRNGVADRVQAARGDAFQALDAARADPRDLVILDPPKYAASRKDVPRALKTYEALNRKGIDALRPGGVLVTCSCSRHVGPDLLLETVKSAGVKAGRTVRLIERRGQAPDHPVLLTCPDGSYLTALFCQVL